MEQASKQVKFDILEKHKRTQVTFVAHIAPRFMTKAATETFRKEI